MESATSNPHLNVFEPYRELSRGHEDQLTRAAMIVLRLVPLARETLLRLIGEPSQSQLPDCVVDMQATNIVDPSEEGATGGRVQRGKLVSVFLTPDIEPFDLAQEITDIDRGQRFDGVLRFDPDLVVVLESKVCRRWARRNGHRVAELNLHGTHFQERRTCLLRWHDLLESWWRLAELGVLAPAEQAIACGASGVCARCCAKPRVSRPSGPASCTCASTRRSECARSSARRSTSTTSASRCTCGRGS
jgi:hypothetical protein